MKLGTGNKKYKIRFKYLDTGRVTIKNVYADSEEEAMSLFKEEYKNYCINVISIIEEDSQMSEEENKAIMQLLWYKKLFDKGYCENCNELCSSGASIPSQDLSKQIEVVLNLIQKQQEEIEKLNYIKRNFDYVVQKETEKKDKIIDLILQDLMACGGLDFIDIGNSNGNFKEDKQKLKQYFEKKVEGK